MAKQGKKVRGVFEKVPGSGVWWIQYFDAQGRRRREKAGLKSSAIILYRKRKTEALEGKKLPEKLRTRVVKFAELANDALEYCRANNRGWRTDHSRIGHLREAFGNRPSELPIEDLRRWFSEQEWTPATFNRYKSMLSLIYRLGMENKKVASNPAKLLKCKHEDNGRIRFLDQNGAYDEERRLRAAIEAIYASHLPEFEIALHTGMRPSEEYSLTWDRVDLFGRQVTVPRSKNGKVRHIPLNSEALAAFKVLAHRSPSGVGPVFIGLKGKRLKGYKHWFNRVVEEAGLADFTWYCLRHTFASRLVMAGVDIRTVAELMGHRTIQMTMRYAHLAPEHNLAAVEMLALFNSGTPSVLVVGPSPTGLGLHGRPSATTTATAPGDRVVGGVVAMH
jgi:integrase